MGALYKLDPLVDVIAWQILGIVALASCSSLRNGPQTLLPLIW